MPMTPREQQDLIDSLPDRLTSIEARLSALDGGTAPAPTLKALALSSTSLTQGTAATLNILNATSGSTITGTPPDGMTLNSSARTISGTPTTAGAYSLVLTETASNVSNSPRQTTINVSVASSTPTPTPVPTMSFANPTATVTEGNSGTQAVTNTINVVRNGATGALTVNLTYGGTATSGSDYATPPSSVTIASGASSVSFDLTVNGDTAVEQNETIVINAALSGYSATASKTITITNDDTTAVTPISPANAQTATFQEVVTFGLSNCFQDTAGTQPCTQVGQRVALVKDAGGNNMLVNGTTNAQPTLQIDSQSGNYALLFDGVDDVLYRYQKNQVRTAFIVYALDFAGKRARPAYQTIMSMAGSYKLIGVTQSSPYNNSDQLIWGYTDNRNNPGAVTTLVSGHTEVIGMVSDATTLTLYRSGKAAGSSAQTGTMPAVDSSKNACIGANSNADGTVSEFTQGLVLGYACSSQTLGASEIPGVSQWFVNLAAQKQTLNSFIGVGFQGDASNSERATASTLVVQHHAANLVDQTEYRPSTISVTYPTTYRDYGLVADAGKLYLTMDATDPGAGIIRLHEYDGLAFTKINEIAATNSRTPGAIAPKFVKNVDDSVYTDGSGRAYLVFNGGNTQNGGNGLCYVRSSSSNWKTGAWDAAQPMPSFSDGANGSVSQIDPIIKRDAAGTWHLLWSDYAAGTGLVAGSGQIRHASSTTGPTGPWTIDAAADFYGLGTGVEAPQIVRLPDGSQVLRYDRTGCGYSVATLPNGMGAAIGTSRPVRSDDIIEHGEVCLIPSGFANPNLQATTSRRPNKWPGKGLMVSGDMGSGAGGADRYSVWQTGGFTGGGASAPQVTTHYGIADPNGDPTASRIQIALGGNSQAYSYLQCNTVEAIGQNFAGQHVFGIWLRGVNGGEKITLGVTNDGFSNFNIPNVEVTLTTSWQYFYRTIVSTFNDRAVMLVGAGGAQGTINVDMWGPSFGSGGGTVSTGAPTLGPELVQNGGFDTSANWTLSNGATIANGVASIVNASGANSDVLQSSGTISYTAGSVYRVAFTYANIVGSCFVQGPNGDVMIPTGSGTYSMDMTANATGPRAARFYNGGLNGSGSIDNLSIKKVG